MDQTHLSPLVAAMLVLDERLALDQEEGELFRLDGAGDAPADVVEDVLPGDGGAVAGNLRGQVLQHVARHHDLAVLLPSVREMTFRITV